MHRIRLPGLAGPAAHRRTDISMREVTLTVHGPWISYSGPAEALLAVVLVAAAAVAGYAGWRLRVPVRLPRPGLAVKIMLVVVWLAALVALVASVAVYLNRVQQAGLSHTPRPDPITAVTLTGVVIVFIGILVALRGSGWRVALGSAVVGAMAAPMVFELPFDVIIMPRTHPLLNPGMYRLLLFGTLIAVDVTTLALLSLSPAARLRRATLWCLAGMLALFAVWALFGYAYPSAPAPVTLNALSKILALSAALTLFLPGRARPKVAEPAQPVATNSARTGVR
jgi:hypothetical protein